MTALTLTPSELKATDAKLIKLQAKNERLRSDLDETYSKFLKLELALSAALIVAEKSNDADDISTCALIRKLCDLPPKKERPRLTLVGEAS